MDPLKENGSKETQAGLRLFSNLYTHYFSFSTSSFAGVWLHASAHALPSFVLIRCLPSCACGDKCLKKSFLRKKKQKAQPTSEICFSILVFSTVVGSGTKRVQRFRGGIAPKINTGLNWPLFWAETNRRFKPGSFGPCTENPGTTL